MGRSTAAYRRSDSPPSADLRLAALAARQHGVVSGRQLRALGFSESAVRRRIAAGRLHRLYPGVFAVGHTALAPRGRWLAAVGACGARVVLSYRSVAALRHFGGGGRALIDVTTPDRSRVGHRGIDLHRVRRLDPADVTVVDGIPTTTVARTLVDLATVLPDDALEKAVHEAEVRRLLDVREVRAAIARAPGRKTAVLAALVASLDVSKAQMERLLLRIVRRAGLPLPVMNTMVCGHEADAFWPDRRLIVELDGAATHLTRKRFVGDRRRDVALLRLGITTVRFTYDDLTVEAHRTEEALADLVGCPAAG